MKFDIVYRLDNPPFGTETSERNLMQAAAEEIKRLRALSPPEPTEGQTERVARAIYHVSCAEADDGERPIPSFDQSHSRLVYLDMARAAIRSMPLQERA